MLINVISDFGEVLSSQKREVTTEWEFVFSSRPIVADYHVVVGQVLEQQFPAGSSGQLFVALEPPEIYRYDLSVLRMYTATIGPGFRYLRRLPRHFVAIGLYPWRIGYDSESGASPLDFKLPQPVASEASAMVTAVVSGKRATSKQRARLAAVDSFQKTIPNFRLAGRDRDLIRDKADLHRIGRFHLAVENARHPWFNTEKLFDGILMKNIMIYDGDFRFLRVFNPSGFHIINVNRRQASRKAVVRVTRSESSARQREALEFNRNLVLTRHNLFLNIEKVVREIRKSDGPVGTKAALMFPAHVRGPQKSLGLIRSAGLWNMLRKLR
jgi:hypothetical protein